jgi:2-polyprenyl-3-methyl-5-hydroxy-6-metoxy-1,4-benzoquinol methylase
MDQESLAGTLHGPALDGLRRINRISRAGAAVWSEIRPALDACSRRPLRVLDVGAGGGDVAAWLALRGEGAIEVDGCDVSSYAVDHARRRAAATRIEDRVRFFKHDVRAGPLPGGYDVVMCSLFLHHFDETDAVQLLARMKDAAQLRVLVQDLRRTRVGYVLAWLGCRVLSRSPVVRADGPASVNGAYTVSEVRAMGVAAGLEDICVRHRWPERFVLSAKGSS